MDRKRSLGKENFGVNLPSTPDMERLGYGTGIGVFLVPSSNNPSSPLAVKKVLRHRRHSTRETVGKRLCDEASILKKLDHPNIVAYKGFWHTNDGRECLALEGCHTSLFDIIDEYKKQTKLFSASTIGKVAFEVGKALDYLHNVVHLLHGDIKAANVLINGDFDAVKLCDFGVTLPLNTDGSLDRRKAGRRASYVGTSLWCAPEVYETAAIEIITDKADIFAYGLTIWEMLARDIPHAPDLESTNTDSSINDTKDSTDDFEDLIGTRPPVPESIANNPSYSTVISLFSSCTEQDYKNRFSAKDVIQFCHENNIN